MKNISRKEVRGRWMGFFCLPVCIAVLCAATPAPGADLLSGLASGQEPVSSHTIGEGDTLYGVASQYGTSVDEPKSVNGLSGSSSNMNVPLMNQYNAGGTYPGGYCAITALRMLLRHLGIGDPGADAVALQGSRPYIPGQGSSGQLLAKRAQQLGIPSANYTTTGSTGDVKNSLARGKPVLTGGIGQFDGTFDGGGRESHNYAGSGHWMLTTGYDEGKRTFTVNDPATGRKIHVGENAYKRFFSPGGDGNVWMVSF